MADSSCAADLREMRAELSTQLQRHHALEREAIELRAAHKQTAAELRAARDGAKPDATLHADYERALDEADALREEAEAARAERDAARADAARLKARLAEVQYQNYSRARRAAESAPPPPPRTTPAAPEPPTVPDPPATIAAIAPRSDAVRTAPESRAPRRAVAEGAPRTCGHPCCVWESRTSLCRACFTRVLPPPCWNKKP